VKPTAERFTEVIGVVEPLIEQRWGIPVRLRDVPHPFTGDLDGAEIHVDYDLTAEDTLFIIVHLFGHTVQWNTSEDARRIGKHPGPWTEPLLAELRAYETDACRLSMQLFHDAGIHDLDQWLSDFAACDYRYLDNFYRTGTKPDFRSFWTEGNAVLTPLAIPDFSPQKWTTRIDGIVI
jgi:hypothetical protein